MNRLLILFGWLMTMISPIFAQENQVFLGVNIPTYYTVGYQRRLNQHFSFNGQVGILTDPFDEILVNIFEAFDADEVLLNTVGKAFSYGVNFQPMFKWHIRKVYFGIAYSCLNLVAKDRPSDVLENYYGIALNTRRSANELTLKSTLHNGGISFGRSFNFKNPAFSVILELSVLKTFAAKSFINNEDGDRISALSTLVDSELSQYYIDYAFIPNLSIYLTYSFKQN